MDDTKQPSQSVLEREGYVSSPLSPMPPQVDPTNNAPVTPMDDSSPRDESKAKGSSLQSKPTSPVNMADLSGRGNEQRPY